MNLDYLMAAIHRYAIEIKPEGEFFTLKCGTKSRFYLDCRNLTLSTDGLHCVVLAITDKLKNLRQEGLKYHSIGGPCVGADPIIGGILYQLADSADLETRGFLVRKAEKDHGKFGRIIGPVRKGDQCVIIEDVITTGSSVLEAIDAIEDFGAKVVHVISIIDRLAGGAEAFAARQMPFSPLLSVRDLGL